MHCSRFCTREHHWPPAEPAQHSRLCNVQIAGWVPQKMKQLYGSAGPLRSMHLEGHAGAGFAPRRQKGDCPQRLSAHAHSARCPLRSPPGRGGPPCQPSCAVPPAAAGRHTLCGLFEMFLQCYWAWTLAVNACVFACSANTTQPFAVEFPHGLLQGTLLQRLNMLHATITVVRHHYTHQLHVACQCSANALCLNKHNVGVCSPTFGAHAARQDGSSPRHLFAV